MEETQGIAIRTYRPGEFLFRCRIISPFHTVHGVLKARILKRFAIPFSKVNHVTEYMKNYGQRLVITEGDDQNHAQEKEVQKGKMVV